MGYMSVSEAAEKWKMPARTVRFYCQQGFLKNIIKNKNKYLIPINTPQPIDKRKTRYKQIADKFIFLFNEIDNKVKELKKKRRFSEGEQERLKNEFLTELTYNSNAIEGSTLTLKETSLILEGITIDQKPLKEHLEAVGHRDAFLYVEEIAKNNIELREIEIKNIHSLVLMNRPQDRGVYRKVPVKISGAYKDPVQPFLIEEKIFELINKNKKRKKIMHPIERIALFHLEFEGIHPFIDGNGRTGRLLLNLELIRNGYPAINIKFTDRRRYYDAFDEFYKNNNADAMILIIAEYLKERLDFYLDIKN